LNRLASLGHAERVFVGIVRLLRGNTKIVTEPCGVETRPFSEVVICRDSTRLYRLWFDTLAHRPEYARHGETEDPAVGATRLSSDVGAA